MKQLNKEEIQKISDLNEQLKNIEKQIYQRAKEQNTIVLKKLQEKENNITDYELEVDISFYKDVVDDEAGLVLEFITPMKHKSSDSNKRWGLDDGFERNLTSVFQKDESLNSQKHCYLMHCLYDDYHLDWDEIFSITCVWFDIKVSYQYKIEIKQSKEKR